MPSLITENPKVHAVWRGNQTLDTLGATLQLHHSRLQSYITGFFFLNVKQCYLCLMQRQLRNILFAKKDNIYKDFNVKVSINLTSVQIDEIFC